MPNINAANGVSQNAVADANGIIPPSVSSALSGSVGGIPTMYLIGGAAVLFLMMGRR